MYMLKSVGDRTPPCAPFLNLRCVDVLFLNVVASLVASRLDPYPIIRCNIICPYISNTSWVHNLLKCWDSVAISRSSFGVAGQQLW